MAIRKMSKPTANDALKPFVFVTWHWREFCRLRSGIPCSAWPNVCAPIFDLLFIITDYDDTMIWIHFSHCCLFCGNPPFVCESPSDCANDADISVSMNNLLNKQSIVRRFEMSWRSFDVSMIQRCYIYFIDLKSVQMILLSTKWFVRTRNIPNL